MLPSPSGVSWGEDSASRSFSSMIRGENSSSSLGLGAASRPFVGYTWAVWRDPAERQGAEFPAGRCAKINHFGI